MWNIEDYLSTKGQDPPNNQQAKVYLFYKPSIFYTHFEHLNMLEEKQSRKSRVRGFDVALGKMIFRKTQVRVRSNRVKMTKRWGHIKGKRDIVWVIEGDFVGSIRVRVIRIKYELFVLCTWSTIFGTILYRFYAWLQRETSRNFLTTCFMEEMSHVFLFDFFFHCCLFSPWWPLAFLIFSLPRIKFSCFAFNKIGFFQVFLSL